MAKVSAVEKNKRRRKMVDRYAAKRAELKAIVKDQSKTDRGALPGAAQACCSPAQFVQDAYPQPFAM